MVVFGEASSAPELGSAVAPSAAAATVAASSSATVSAARCASPVAGTESAAVLPADSDEVDAHRYAASVATQAEIEAVDSRMVPAVVSVGEAVSDVEALSAVSPSSPVAVSESVAAVHVAPEPILDSGVADVDVMDVANAVGKVVDRVGRLAR